ncbi:MAG: alcohol dehydrogenase catalytic domain-containing protein [Lachnospiraceae bacterium]|nr:alcohol dehydrogenase catalytic domain-containing protein [Lachnospiraceae bacterium]
MKAVYYVGDDHMEMRDIPVPEPKEDEYLVKIDACGVCGSDYEGYKGKTGRRVAPMIMGHECAGTIVKKPVAGGKMEPGTTVAIFPKFFCGVCPTCLSGKVNICPNANFLGVLDYDGAMTEFVCVKEQYLIPYEGASADIASLAEPAAVAYHAINKISDEELAAAENILLVGAGTIGMMALIWLKCRGAKHVIVSDMSRIRLDLAGKMGADDVIDPSSCGDFEKAVAEKTGGKMCDISVEAVGISPTAQSAVDALRPAGLSVWIGNAAKMVSINMQYVVTKELTIKGNYIYSYRDFCDCVKLLSEKKVDVSPVISLHLPMARGDEAFRMLDNNGDGKLIKIVLENK